MIKITRRKTRLWLQYCPELKELLQCINIIFSKSSSDSLHLSGRYIFPVMESFHMSTRHWDFASTCKLVFQVNLYRRCKTSEE